MSAVIGALHVNLGMNSSAFQKGASEVERRLAGMRKTFDRVGSQLQGVGQTLSVGLSAPILAFGGLALRAGGDFEAAMNRVGAISGATESELEALGAAAKEMGATTQYSASQAADALGFLTMAGFSANEAIAALPGTLQLAAAAQMDLGEAADIVSNVLSGYGMTVEELGRVNDVLVKTFTSANTDLSQLGEALKYAGPIASAAGIAFEESAAAIGLMGNAGIQASMAGTSLRGAIGRILDPSASATRTMEDLGLSFTDSEGKILSFDQIIRQLEPHADNAGLFMELFGQRAGPAMAALVSQGADALVDLRAELEGAGGTAAAISEGQMQGFNGAMKRLASAFEAVQIAIAESGLLDFATRLADGMAGLLSQLAEADPALLRVGTIVAGVAAAMGPLLVAAGAVAIAIGAILPVVGALAVPLATLASVAGVVVLAWEPLGAAFDYVREHLHLLSPVIGLVARALVTSLVPAAAAAVKGALALSVAVGKNLFMAMAGAVKSLALFKTALISTGIGAAVLAVGYLVAKFMKLADSVGGVGNAFVVLKAIAAEVARRIGMGWDGLRAVVTGAGLAIRAAALDTLAAVLDLLSGFVNKYIGLYVGAYKAVVAAWDALPAAFRNLGARAMNALIDAVEGGLAGLVGGMNAVLGAVRLPTIPPPDLSGWKTEVGEAVDVVDAAGTAFVEAFTQDYTKPVREGLEAMADEARAGGEAASEAGRAMLKATTEPLETVKALSEAQRMLARQNNGVAEAAEEAGGAIAGATGEAGALGEALDDAGDSGKGMGDDVARGGRAARDALKETRSAAEETREALAGIGKGFLEDLASGDARDAFSGLFEDVKNLAARSLGNLFETAFSAGGGGLAGMLGGLTESFRGVTSGVSALFSGGGIAALGGVLSSAMPILGAGLAIFNLIRSFSSRELIGSGLQLGVSGGEVFGDTFERFDVSTFWGLFRREVTETSPFDEETLAAFQAQVNTVRGGVQEAFGALGISVSEGFLSAVEFAMREIDTADLNEEEAAELISGVFAEYGDALARAVGGVGLEAVQTLAQVQSALDPLGMAFELTAKRVTKASGAIDLVPFAEAAESLAALAGGAQALTEKTAAFFEAFYSDAEKLGVMESRVADTFARLGLAVPRTDAAFRELVLSQDLMTEAGREAYAALLDIAPVFDAVTDAAEEAAQAAAEAAQAQLEAIQAAEAERLAALEAERALIADLTSAREGLLFNLLSDDQQIEFLRQEIADTFANIGIATPENEVQLREVLLGLDLSEAVGRDAYAAISEIVAGFQRVVAADAEAAAAAAQAALEAAEKAAAEAAEAAALELEAAEAFAAAVADMRGAYSFDASGYASEWEAKLSDELQNPDRYSQDVIAAQNTLLAEQTTLLEEIRHQLEKQNRTARDELTFGQLS